MKYFNRRLDGLDIWTNDHKIEKHFTRKRVLCYDKVRKLEFDVVYEHTTIVSVIKDLK